MTAAVLAVCSPTGRAAPQHRQLAREGDRSHRRHGDRTAQARRSVEEGTDSLRIAPPRRQLAAPRPAIDTYDDHRIAMCFSLAALGGVPVRINDPECVPRLSRLFPACSPGISRALTRCRPASAGHRDRRPLCVRQGHRGSSVARRSAFHYLDSGALYRLVASPSEPGSIRRRRRAWLHLPPKLEVEFSARRSHAGSSGA